MKPLQLVRGCSQLCLGNLFHRRYPVSVVLSVTNRCNLQCRYCNYHERSASELSTAELLTLIDQMGEAGVQRLGFFGGEPLLRDDIAALARRARERDMYVSLITNGWLLPRRRELLDHLDLLIVSYDGPAGMHDANRGDGAHEKALAAIDLALAARVPVWTITTLTRHNIDAVEHVARLAKEKGFGATFQFLYHNGHLGKDHGELLPSRAQSLAAVERLLRLKKEGYPVVSSAYYLKELLRWPDFSRNIISGHRHAGRCTAGRFYCSVDTDGKLYPCSPLIEDVEGISCVEHGFAGAFRRLNVPRDCACLSSCMIEHRYLFSLSPGSLVELARTALPAVLR